MQAVRILDPRVTTVARKGGGKGGGGGGGITTPHQPVDSPNTLRSLATARVLEVLSEGVVYGIDQQGGPSVWCGVYLDGTPVSDLAGNFNFNIREGFFRYGYPAQDPIPGWPIAEGEQSVGVECTPFVPVVRTLNLPLSAVRWTLQIPALYTQESDGDVTGASVSYAFDIAVDGGPWTNIWTERIYGKTMSPYQRSVRAQLPYAASSIAVRVERLDPTAPSGTSNTLNWSSYTEIVDGQLAYDDTSIAALTIDAQQFANVPQRAYRLMGVMIQLPTTYNGLAHSDAGNWDGTFYTQWSNNPAWWLYAWLTNERWGLGRLLDPSATDKWSFYESQLYNDQPVDDGNGGIEPRFTCNGVVNTRQDAYTVLQAVASNMLGQLYYGNGTVTLVQDRPLYSPTRLFSPADVVDGLFDYTSADVRSRFNAAAVTWNDPDDDFKPAVELVQDPTLVAQQGYRETQQTYFGCTSKGQARRYGRWLIYTGQFETEVASFTTGLENADLRPGDLILISDPSRVGARLGGRVLASTTDTLTLDAVPDEVIETTGWKLYVTVGTAASATRPTVVELTLLGVDPENVVRVSGKTVEIPPGSMWLAHSTLVEASPWRVAAISDKGSFQYAVTATEYHVEKFAYVDTGVIVAPPPFSLIPTGPLAAPRDLRFREYIYLDGTGLPQFGVVISWTPSPDARVTRYQLEMSGPAGDYRKYTHIAGVAQDVPAMRQGQWQIVLRAFDNIGRRSQAVSLTFIPTGLSARPLPPAALYITPQGGNLITLEWTPTGEIDVVFYWVKWTKKTEGQTWENATTSIARVGRNTTQIQTPMRAGTYMVKSIDALGQESLAWAEAILEPQQTEQSRVLDEAQQPAWAGDHGALWHANGVELWLPPPDAAEPVPPGVFPGDRGIALNESPTRIGVYAFDGGFDLGTSTRVTMTAYVEAHGRKMGVMMAHWVPLSTAAPLALGASGAMAYWKPLASAVPLVTNVSAEWDAHIEARVSVDGVTWGDWFPLRSTVITAQKFEWRLVGTVYDLATTLQAQEAGVLIDVPLRSVQGSDAALDATGHLTVTYAVPFIAPPVVQITARQSVAPGGNIVLLVSDDAHFEVEHRDATGAPHAGSPNASIDYFVQGYGGHL